MIRAILNWLFPPSRPPAWISWYVTPVYPHPMLYLGLNSEGDHEYYLSASQAHLFLSRDAALAVTPKYDGSGRIEQRTGVIKVTGMTGVIRV